MTGHDAASRLLAASKHEEMISLDVLARALGVSKRKLIRDWRRRMQPETRVGRDVLLASRLVVETYFPHISGQRQPLRPHETSE